VNKIKDTPALKPQLVMVLLLTLVFPLVFFQLFSANFISWDDADVLLKNKDVHQFNVKAFFVKHYVGNYAPLTMIGFAIDWALFHGSAFWHHFINVMLHLINALLVFLLIKKLTNNLWTAFLVYIVFSFHPTQIETVAWVAAKNNLLYSSFFLSALICYVNYIQQKHSKYYIFSLVLFVLSVLSKPSAICFPLCLLAIDYFLQPKLSTKVFINKIPFFIISIIIGVATIYSRTEDKFINESHAFAIHERIGYAGYAIWQYLYKFLIPINLSVIYPYPSNKTFSLVVGYGVLIILGALCYRLVKRKNKIVLLGLSFFIINLLLVLQFIPFGEVLTADRYLYLPIIGLTLILFSLVKFKEKDYKFLSTGLIVVLGSLSFVRTAVWKNSISLYSDIIDKYPHSFVALNSLGAEHMLNKNYQPAQEYLNKAIAENQNYYKGYYNRGLLFAQTNRMNEAISDFTKAIELKQYPKAYVGRANVYYVMKDFPKAISDAETVLKIDNNNIKANFVLANCYDDLNQMDKAIVYYNKVITLNPDEPNYYLRRAILFGKMQQFTSCLNDLNAATTLNPQYAEAYYWKGVVKVNLKQNPCEDLKQALKLGFQAAQQPLMNYCR
jgi:tetratricopeptide (TPR) repeat protein